MPFRLQQNLLPETYTVGPNDVIIGRGKKCTQNPGNKRFKAIVQATLDLYSSAPTKVKKSEIILQVLSQVRDDGGLGFIKQVDVSSGRYMQVEEAACRIAIAQAFRDALSDSYRSSKKNKQVRRLERIRGEQGETAFNALSCETVSRSIFSDPAPMPTLYGSFLGKSKSPAASAESALSSRSVGMFNLYDILNEATTFDTSLDNEPLTAEWMPEPVAQLRPSLATTTQSNTAGPSSTDDLFAKLYAVFAQGNVNTACNPFEPTPIADGSNLSSMSTFMTQESRRSLADNYTY